jgi:Outer membrane protein beta-barrel family/CarboxypepD_reg-like domain
MKPVVIIIVNLIITLASYGQFKVSGVVVDSVTKVALANASASNTSSKPVTTNSKGQFNFNSTVGKQTISISFIGYKTLHIEKDITSDTKLDTIFLALQINATKAVRVIAQKPLLSMTAGKITMNVAESGLSVGNTGWELLQVAPGVKATDEGSVSLNGKSVTIYIDGRPSYVSGDQLKNLLSSMPSNSIDKIELLSNPSAKYQANGAAIINIKTNKLKNYGANGTLTTVVGTSRYFRGSQNIDLNYRKNKVNVYGGVNAYKNGSINISSNNRILKTTGLPIFADEPSTNITKSYGYGLKLGLDYDITKKTSIGFLVNGGFTNRKRTGTSTSFITQQRNNFDSIITNSTFNKVSYITPSANVYLKTNFDSTDKELIINADYYQYNQNWNDDFTTNFLNQNIPYKSAENRRDNSPTILDIFSSTVDYSQSIKKAKLEAGLKTTFIKTDNNIKWESLVNNNWENDVLRTNYFIYKENVNAAYVGLTKTLKKVDVEAILRAEHTSIVGNSITLNNRFTKNYINWFPSVTTQYSVNKNNQLALSYRKSIDRPNYSYVNPFKIFRGQFNFFEGNPNMNPTFTHSVELTHTHKYVLFTTLSYNYIDQFSGVFVKQDPITKVLISFPDNYKAAQQVTLNATYSKQVKPYWFTNTAFSASYFKAEYPGITPRPSNVSYSLGSFNSFTLKKAKIKLEIYTYGSLPFHDGFYYHGIYSNCNIAANKEILKKHGFLRMNVTNVFGVNNVESRTEIGDVYVSNRIFRDSRSVNMSFTYKFGNKNVKQAKTRRSKISSETNRVG